MKIKLIVSDDRYDEIKGFLMNHNIEIDDNADLVLSECNRFTNILSVKESNSDEIVLLPVSDIVFIETFGRAVVVHTNDHIYHATDRLYKICSLLDPEQFIRISNSVVIAKDKVQRITPSLFMKFILTMSDGTNVDVTRSYYYIFKEHFNI